MSKIYLSVLLLSTISISCMKRSLDSLTNSQINKTQEAFLEIKDHSSLELPINSNITKLVWSNNNLLGGIDDKSLLIWDCRTKKLIQTIYNTEKLTVIAWSDDDSKIAIGNISGLLTIYDFKNSKFIHKIQLNSSQIKEICWLDNQRLIVLTNELTYTINNNITTYGYGDSVIFICNPEDQAEQMFTFSQHLSSIKLAKDKKYLTIVQKNYLNGYLRISGNQIIDDKPIQTCIKILDLNKLINNNDLNSIFTYYEEDEIFDFKFNKQNDQFISILASTKSKLYKLFEPTQIQSWTKQSQDDIVNIIDADFSHDSKYIYLGMLKYFMMAKPTEQDLKKYKITQYNDYYIKTLFASPTSSTIAVILEAINDSPKKILIFNIN